MGKERLAALGRDRRVWLAASVLGLAAVIFGVAAISSPRAEQVTSPEKITLSGADSLAAQAESAASIDDTATARSFAERALAEQPDNQRAKKVLERVAPDSSALRARSQGAEQPAGGDGNGSGGGSAAPSPAGSPAPSPAPGGSPPPDEPAPAPLPAGRYADDLGDPATLLPAAIVGWNRGSVIADATQAQVTYEPNGADASAATLVRAQVFVHERASAEAAGAFVGNVDRVAYPVSAATVVVGDGMPAYRGRDRTRLAVVAFARGRYAFEVIVIGQSSSAQAAAEKAAAKIAGTLPAAHR
jgi:SWI/SNF-related matrix-associated actin-dependent regulator 1 of chromatin subfamily A